MRILRLSFVRRDDFDLLTLMLWQRELFVLFEIRAPNLSFLDFSVPDCLITDTKLNAPTDKQR